MAESDKDRYNRYISSTQWANRREELFEKRGHKCERSDCTSENSLQVHHLTYERMTEELDEDLMILCFGCHTFVTLYYRVLKEKGINISWQIATDLGLELLSRYKSGGDYKPARKGLTASTKNVMNGVDCSNCGAIKGRYCNRPFKKNGKPPSNHRERNIAFREINDLPIPVSYAHHADLPRN